jgi:hypothetical protein
VPTRQRCCQKRSGVTWSLQDQKQLTTFEERTPAGIVWLLGDSTSFGSMVSPKMLSYLSHRLQFTKGRLQVVGAGHQPRVVLSLALLLADMPGRGFPNQGSTEAELRKSHRRWLLVRYDRQGQMHQDLVRKNCWCML